MKKGILILLGFLSLLPISSLQAVEVVAIRPAAEVVVEPGELLHDIYPEAKQGKPSKKKRSWFKNLKADILEKKFNKLFPELQFDSLQCDVIVLKNGEEIEASILEVNTGAIVYELCDQENGPKRTMLISKVFMIKYKDGYKEVFNSNPQNDRIERQKSGPDRAAFVIGLLLGFMLGLLGVLLAYVIYRKDDYSRKKATRGALLGVLAIVLLYLYLLSIA